MKKSTRTHNVCACCAFFPSNDYKPCAGHPLLQRWRKPCQGSKLPSYGFYFLLLTFACWYGPTIPLNAQVSDSSSSYTWKPVEIGGGGLVTGIINHPTNGNVRFARTDVGGAYRWDNSARRWRQMVRREGNAGLPADLAKTPNSTMGVESIAVDPNNASNVYMAIGFLRSQYAKEENLDSDNKGVILKSTDGGLNFSAMNISVEMDANGSWRSYGERLAVDPNNGNTIYFGSSKEGLWRTTNGQDWKQVSGNGAPPTSSNVIGVRIHKSGNSSIVYALVARGQIYRSTDGGQNWTNISSNTAVSDRVGNSTLDRDGKLWVCQYEGKEIYVYNGSSWTTRNSQLPQNLTGVAVDPQDVNRVFALAANGAVSRSLDGGANFTVLANKPLFSGNQGWLPQQQSPDWHGTCNIYFDANRKLWIAQGNEGVLYYDLGTNNSESAQNPPKWTVRSLGIEEMVTHQIIIPKGGGGKVYASFHDTTGFIITDPASVSGARHIPLQDQLISNGFGIASLPGNPDFVAISSSDINNTSSGKSYSGWSKDGGSTWRLFSGNSSSLQCGSIAISRRNGWGEGSDRLVLLPGRNRAPHYSHDGGANWTRSPSFSEENGRMPNREGIWNLSLKQSQLVADPFTANLFLLKFTSGGLWRSTDGGVNWSRIAENAIPEGTHHGHLLPNENIQNDYWFASGWEGAYDPQSWNRANANGLWRSTNGGTSWSKISGVRYAICAALGAGRGQSGDASFTVYFYGLMNGDNNFGIFRSTNAGQSWERISYYPAGVVDRPSCMAASWDNYGTVYIGFGGTSLVWGTPNGSNGGGSGGGNGGSDGSNNGNPGAGSGSGSITRDVWNNIQGAEVSKIPVDTTPSTTGTLTSFEAPTNAADNYGQRVHGFLHPSTSGTYTFWIAADDTAELWLSTDDSSSNAKKIAEVPGWTENRQWDKYTQQRSSGISLQSGRKYYIRALMKEAEGGDNLAVSWRLNNTTPSKGDATFIIPGSALSPFKSENVDKINSVSWPSTVKKTGPVSVTVNYTVSRERRLVLHVWDGAWSWRSLTSKNVSGSGQTTLTINSYSSIDTSQAHLRVDLQDTGATTTLQEIYKYNIPTSP